MTYAEFLAAKAVAAQHRGLATVPPLASHLYPFQAACVAFGLRAGSWACFLDTGLGKTAVELEWCRHAADATNGRALLLTPLAVARQIEAAGRRWGYAVRVIRHQDEATDGISVCNYDRLAHLDLSAFGAVALDESSVLKQRTGKTSHALIDALAGHRFRLCATATPAPNDHMELGMHAECLGVMRMDDMLTRWFAHDSGNTSVWRLKGHARTAFWAWVATWARMATHPRDLGDDRDGFTLLPLETVRHHTHAPVRTPGSLFDDTMSATDMFRVKRETAAARARELAGVVANEPDERWVLWCDTDAEADAVHAALDARGLTAAEVRGSHSIDRKESTLAAFDAGESRILLTKPACCGHGLNWQHTARMAFVGRSFSYELYYQAVRRCYRFGQTRPVVVHLILAPGEGHIGSVLDRKATDHRTMQDAMRGAMETGA